MRPLLTFIVVFALALGGYLIGRVTAATSLVTPDEVNTVNVVNRTLPALVKVIAHLPASARQPGDAPDEIGSGFFYKPGVILTNYHVIQLADSIQVQTSNGKIASANVIASDIGLDIAILAVNGLKSSSTLKFGSSKNLLRGQKLLVLGTPLGIPNFVSTGILATRGRTDPPASDIGLEIPEMLHTTASIQVGNSGGPVLDSRGTVVGLADAELSSNGFSPGGSIGLAIPIDIVAESVSDLEKVGIPQRGTLGITMSSLADIEPIIRKQAGFESTDGAIVESVPAGSVGALAGLRGAGRNVQGQLTSLGDVIVSVAGQRVKDQYAVIRIISTRRPGNTVSLQVWRNKRLITLKAQMTRRTK